MRSLLDVREQYLNEFSFPDPYAEVSYDVCNPFQSYSVLTINPSCLPFWFSCYFCAIKLKKRASLCKKQLFKVLKMTWPCVKKRRGNLAYQIPFSFGFAFDWLERLNCDLIGCKIMHETLELL